ncbi:hypothetical protein PO878_21085 [Iamia majanohamensis]|uniref:Uncharacterized protein n=1 Tax=Iamia majanohamensis TaxID=467976 RepID=A0AAE9Y5N9_9ACTN|nr:hypothetical protein [Iamia majanohamensis]WCO66990.1 hypothetical protein PO878_21085 [Iamia majanohamensis]
MDDDLFAQVHDVVRALGGPSVDDVRARVRRYGIKLWTGAAQPPRLHYEAQVVGRRHVDGRDGVALEVGFHAEHRDEAENEAVLDRLLASEGRWRPRLGAEATAGAFLGAPHWRRVSDVWLEPDLGGDDVAFEVGSRLVDYLEALGPLLGGDPGDRGARRG